MKAVVVKEFGNPETYVFEEQGIVPLQESEVRLDIKAAGISLIDVLVSQGKYQLKPPLPYVPGTEFSGIVCEVGSKVKHLKVGDRVLGGGMGGGYAEQCVLPANTVTKIPENMSFEDGSVFRVSYSTAYHALAQRARLKRGETVLVLGAAGAIGVASIQVAKALGATVIASASTQEKRNLTLSLGADYAIDSNAEDWRDQVKKLTDGKGIDIVLDPVGGKFTEKAFRSLAWEGRHLVVGFSAGSIPALPINLALLKGASLVGVDIRQVGIYQPHLIREAMTALFELYAQGSLRPAIAKVVPLADYKQALNAVINRQAVGRIVLAMA